MHNVWIEKTAANNGELLQQNILFEGSFLLTSFTSSMKQWLRRTFQQLNVNGAFILANSKQVLWSSLSWL